MKPFYPFMTKLNFTGKFNLGVKNALIMLLAGALSALAFPPFGLWFILPLSMLPLWRMAAHLPPAKAFVAGWLWGMGLYLAAMYWIIHTMTSYGGLPLALALLLFFLFCLYLGLYVAVLLWLLARLAAFKFPISLAAPFLWAGLEFLRGHLLTGFPWLPLSLSLTGYPPLLQTAEYWGATGLSALMVALSVFLAYGLGLVKALAIPKRIPYMVSFIFILCWVWLWGAFVKLERVETEMSNAPQALVSVVQGNIPLDKLWQRGQRVNNVMRQLALSAEAAGSAPTRPWLLVWSESAAPFVFLEDVDTTMLILRETAGLRAWLALGSTGIVDYEGQRHYSNRMYLVSPEGQPVDYYDKVHLVPFGEYVPLAKVFFFVRAIAALAVDMAPGQAGKTLEAQAMVLGPLICYESIFADLARQHRLNGANLLLNPTNDAWFGHTGASAQHFAHLVLRAVENRISCARAANTGISGFIMPNGRVVEETNLFTSDTRTTWLPLLQRETLFSRWGDIVGLVGAVFCGLAWAGTVFLYRYKKRKKNND